MCTIVDSKELLNVKPVTEASGELMHSERTMRVIAHTILPLISTFEPRSTFTRNFMRSLEPWVNVHSKEGKMTKRIAAYLYEQYKTDLDGKLMSGIGSFLAAEAPTGKFYYDITNTFNWKHGDFGDSGSCFMHGRGNVLRAMEDEGGVALRYFKNKDGSKGTGRAWVMPGPEGLPVIFNAYGPSLGQFIARLQIITPGVPVSMVRLTNKRTATGDLYINGGVGAVIGCAEPDFSIEHDFDIDTESSRRRRCSHCRQRMGSDYNFVVTDQGGYWTESENNVVCDDCLEAFYEEDELFHQWFPKESLQEMTLVGYAYRGGSDGYGYLVADLVTVKTQPQYARAKADGVCHQCNNLSLEGLVRVMTGNETSTIMCLSCARDYNIQCRYCGSLTKDSSLICQCGYSSRWQPRR